MARNLRALLPLVAELGTNQIAFCTDDRDPEDIAENGHLNGMVREAVAAGIGPEDALVLASYNPAVWHRLWNLGAIAPGYQADLLVLPDLVAFRPEVVLKRGREVGEIERPEVPEWVKHSVRIKPVSAADFRIPWTGGRLRAIGLVEDQVVTESRDQEPAAVDGWAIADAGRDLAKIAVVERHLGTGRIGLGFVHGSGLTRGALASSVAHDAHNIVVVGMSDDDMAFAVTRLAELGGGVVAVEGGTVLAELALPVAGLLADAPLEEVISRSLACNDAARALGWSGATPFLTLSFLGAFGDPASEDHRRRVGRRRSVRDRPAAGMRTLYSRGWIVTCDAAETEHSDGWVLVEDGMIAAVGGGEEPEADARVELGGAIVTPGLVNAHHHLYQTLTRGRAQEADLFSWLRELYPVWARIDAEAEYAAASTGLAELALSGCTTAFDHHYVFPQGREGLIEAEVQAARELGVRIVASRGSMDLGASDGGLPPDELVEELDDVLADTERLVGALHEPGHGARVQIAVAPCSPSPSPSA